MRVVTRFAPAPTGRLHVGNIRTAVHNWLWARKNGGRFILRLDDTDRERSREEHVAGIREDLAWLGLDPDEEHRQSARFDRYEAALERLKAAGRVYPAYETAQELELKRKVQLGRGKPPVYDRAALGLTDAEYELIVEKLTGQPAASRAWSYKERRKEMLLALLDNHADEFDSAVEELGKWVDHLRQAGIRGFIAEHTWDDDFTRPGGTADDDSDETAPDSTPDEAAPGSTAKHRRRNS